MNALGWVLAGFLVGWILGVWMSHRKIQAERKARINQFGRELFKILEDNEILQITISEDGKSDIKFDQAGFDELLGGKPTKH